MQGLINNSYRTTDLNDKEVKEAARSIETMIEDINVCSLCEAVSGKFFEEIEKDNIFEYFLPEFCNIAKELNSTAVNLNRDNLGDVSFLYLKYDSYVGCRYKSALGNISRAYVIYQEVFEGKDLLEAIKPREANTVDLTNSKISL